MEKPAQILASYYHRNGYVRVPNEERLKRERQKYKKGYEVRLVARSQSEIEEIRQALDKFGIKPGKPFKKAKQIVLPIYGKEAFEQFKSIIQDKP